MKYSQIKLLPFAAALAIIAVQGFTDLFWDLLDLMRRMGVGIALFHLGSRPPFWEFTGTFLVTLAVIAIARWWAKEPWSSVGISYVTLVDVLLGFGGLLLYVNYIYIETPVLAHWIKTNFSSFAGSHFAPQPEWQEIWIPVTASLFEEIATRAYIIEHILNLSGSLALAGIASLCLSVAIHLPGRNLGQMMEVVPILLFLTLLYVWRRNIVPGVMTHCLGNAVGTLVLLPERWQIMWLYNPTRNWIVLAAGVGFFLILNYVLKRSSEAGRRAELTQKAPT